MIDNNLEQLEKDAKHIHSGKTCILSKWIFLPFWKSTPYLWGIEKAEAGQLDQIFFNLLSNGITTRKGIAMRLGIDKDEFIFTHLDILIREGYVSGNENSYELTKLGKSFMARGFLEQRLKKIRHPFIWGEINARIEESISPSDPTTEQNKIEHGDPPDDDKILDAITEHFNKQYRDEEIAFYSIVSSEKSSQLYYRKIYAKYAVLFYANNSDKSDWIVDLRVQHNDTNEFSLCEEMNRIVNEKEYWREKFEEIYNRK